MTADAPLFGPHFGRRSRSVNADLDEIFQHAAPAGAAADAPQRARVFGAGPSRAARTSAAGLGALVTVGLLGLAVGAALTRPPGPPQPPPPASQPSVAVAPTARVAAAPPVVIPAPSETAPAPSATPRQAAAKPSSPSTGCQHLRGDARARCAYPAVLAADKRLRAAYARASRAGVSRSTLARYRSRWAGLRRHASDEPARVIVGYRAMANELTGLTRRRRG